MTWRVERGDCVEVLAAMPAESVDAVVCDPPYGIGFMGKDWDSPDRIRSRRDYAEEAYGDDPDHALALRLARGVRHADAGASNGRAFQAWCEEWAAQALRVLKPGGHLLAFGGTRTYHRLTAGIEDAGFEVRDCIAWLYGSGFPKSLDVSKAIDKAAGAEREVVGQRTDGRYAHGFSEEAKKALGGVVAAESETGFSGAMGVITAPATPEAAAWEGWGTALKPAFEPIVVARKPLAGTVAANVLEHGAGALNIDGCRIAAQARPRVVKTGEKWASSSFESAGSRQTGTTDEGRWPANVVLDEDAGALLDEQTGDLAPGNHPASRQGIGYTLNGGGQNTGTNGERRPTEAGGASRFFYCAKASSAERNAGLDAFPEVETGKMEDDAYEWAVDGKGNPRTAKTRARNVHPTVKPIDLMRWLVRLVTPPGGTVLDPFTGSGTTGCAAVLEGLAFVGIERDDEYAAIAEARIEWWASQPEGIAVEDAIAGDARRRKVADTGQLGLLG